MDLEPPSKGDAFLKGNAMTCSLMHLSVSGPGRPNGPERSVDYALVSPQLRVVAEAFQIVDRGVSLPAYENARLLAAAWNSYQMLARRLGVDPVALAEGDALGKLHEACEKSASFFNHKSVKGRHRIEELADWIDIHSAVSAALQSCRGEPQPAASP